MRQILLLAAMTLVLLFNGSTTQAAGDDPVPNFTVNVHDAANKPIAAATVSVQVGRSSQEALTGEDGAAHLNIDLTKARGISATINAADYAGIIKYWISRGPTAPAAHFDVTLDKAVLISGRVLDQNGKPVDGARVMVDVNKNYPDTTQRPLVNFTSAVADSDGKWTFGGIPENFDSINLAAYDKHCLTSDGFIQPSKWPDPKTLRDGSAILTLKRGTPVTLTVVDADGQPLAGAKVGYGRDRVASNVLPEEKTGADGTVKLGVIPGNTAVITLLMKGYAPELIRADVADKPLDLKVTMKPGELLEGTVNDSSGKPIKGATVFIDTWRDARTIQARIQTDATGHFTWPDAPTDEVKVDVLSTKGEKRGVIMKAGGENIVTLVAATTFKGTVIDADTGKPVTNYKLMFGIDSKDFPQPVISWENATGREPFQLNGGTFEATFTYPYPARAVRVISDDYLPCDSDEFPLQGQTVEYTFKLKRGVPVKGTVVDADGKPVAKAKVILLPYWQLDLQNIRLGYSHEPQAETTEGGTFTFPPQKFDCPVMAMTDQDYAVLDTDAIEKGEKLVLKRWGRIEGEFYEGTKPVADAEVQDSLIMSGPDKIGQHLRAFDFAKTDAQGKFVFDHAMAGIYSVVHLKKLSGNFSSITNQLIISVSEGQTAHVKLGGLGRPIIGHIAPPPGMAAGTYTYGYSSMIELPPNTGLPIPDDVLKMPQPDRRKWQDDFYKTDAGRKWGDELIKKGIISPSPLQFEVQADGSFRIPDVKEGPHTLSIFVADNSRKDLPQNAVPLGIAGTTFTVPTVPNGVSDDPLDLGTLEIKPFAMHVGDNAPDFTLKTSDGKNWRLSDQKGKVTLLYMWDVFFPYNPMTDAQLNNVWRMYGAGGKFTMIGVGGGVDSAELERRLLKVAPVQWPMAIVHDAPDALFKEQYRAVPCLIGPDGKIIAAHLTAATLDNAVADAIKSVP